MTTNNDIQKYIDALKEAQKRAQEKYDSDLAKESLVTNIYSKAVELQGFLRGLVDIVRKTLNTGSDYARILERSITQGEKIGRNASWGLSATKILICQAIKTSNCAGLLQQRLKDLSDSLAKCSIPAGTISALITELTKELEAELTNVTDLFNSLLNTLQLEQDLSVSLSGKKGLVFQLTAMKNHAYNGKKDDVDSAELACRPHDPFLTSDIEASLFYKKLKDEFKKVDESIPGLLTNRDIAKSTREKSEAKKDALTKALDAAMKAKSCDVKK